jgi:hypothetical protein
MTIYDKYKKKHLCIGEEVTDINNFSNIASRNKQL